MIEFLKNLVIAVFQAIIFSLIFLFFLRQYILNKKFSIFLNHQFDVIIKYGKKWEEWLKSRETRLTWFGLSFFLLSFMAIGYQWSLLYPLIILGAIYIGIPWVIEMNRRSTYTDLDKVIEMINDSHISNREIVELKTAISAYYRRKYRPKEINFNEATGLSKAIGIVLATAYFLIHPKVWFRLLIPKLTLIPPFDQFWRSSAYHARYDPYRAVVEYIHQAVDVPGIDLTLKNIEIHPPIMMVYFRPKDKHQRARAGKLASLIEGELSMAPKTIIVQSQEDKLLLLIPLDADV